MKLFQIEEPDGSPGDPEAPGAAIGIDASGAAAVVAMAVGGNAVVLPDREGFALDLPVPEPAAAMERWQGVFEGARIRAERALARPVTHAVIAAAGPLDPAAQERLQQAAEAAGLAVLRLIEPHGAAPALDAAVLAEELMPRPGMPDSP
ncbi:MAG TPA: hypothetical protein VJ770_22240 [Stellaceae bacterium]|nr:hypothetical protein [Stellaceae bacterium]